MSDLQVIAATSRRDRAAFVELPYRLRAGDDRFVPMLRADVWKLLDRQRHPFWREGRAELFLARRGKQTLGRVAAIECPAHDRHHGGRTGFFGFLECTDDRAVAAALLRAVEDWHRARGTLVVRGPVSPSTNYECGLLVDGFDARPALMMPCNPPYLPPLVEGCGYGKAMDLLAYLATSERLARADELEAMEQKLAQRSNVRVRPLDMQRFDAEVEVLRQIYNDAWSENWGFVPMPADEFRIEAEGLRQLAQPGFVMIAEAEGRPVAFIAAFRDITPGLKAMRGRFWSFGLLKLLWLARHAKHLRVAIAGVVKEHRRSGVMALLYLSVIRTGLQRGVGSAELSWVLETNTAMRRIAESLGAVQSRVFRIYEKRL